MLVDPAGQMVELSTTSYAPTPPIWRHRATDTRNGWPACEEDHKVKHAPGFSITQDPHTGGFVLQTAAGFSHQVPIPTHPVCGWDRDLPEAPEIQISGSELLHALHHVLDYRESDVPCRPDLEWEFGDDSETATIMRHLLHQAETRRDTATTFRF